MERTKPFFDRRARRPWSGLALAGAVGAVATTLVAAVGAGLLVAGSPLAHAQPATLLAALGATLLAALAGALVVGPVLAWRLKTGRLTPLWALAAFLAPWAVAAVAALLGWPSTLATYAPYLLTVFAFQALGSWGVFAYWSFPPYAAKPSRRARRPRPDSSTDASVDRSADRAQPDDPESDA